MAQQTLQRAGGTGNPRPAVHWPTLALTAGLAGFAFAGMIGVGWAWSRPAAPRPKVVVYVPSPAVVAPEPLPASQPEPVVLARGEDKHGGLDDEALAPGRRAAPDLLGEPVAVFKKAVADPAPPPEPPAAPPALLVAEPAAEAAACEVPGTAVRFARTLTEAARQAKERDKLLLVMHISGHFEDPGFTWNNAQAFRVKALADESVGRYLTEHFVAAYQKVGTFRLVNGAKNGGNVATYFCLPDRTVIHVLPGPVDAATLLREARWAVETRELARLTATAETKPDKVYGRYKALLRKAHADRLANEHGVRLDLTAGSPDAATYYDIFRDDAYLGRHGRMKGMDGDFHPPRSMKMLNPQGRAHEMLALQPGSAPKPLLRLEHVYKVVFEKFLGEKVSTLPVQGG